MKRLTEDETQQPNESTSESEESIHHIKELRTIEEMNKHHGNNQNQRSEEERIHHRHRITSNNNATDERIMKFTAIQKLTKRYQNVKKGE